MELSVVCDLLSARRRARVVLVRRRSGDPDLGLRRPALHGIEQQCAWWLAGMRATEV
jgi:hypothetical protein